MLLLELPANDMKQTSTPGHTNLCKMAKNLIRQ
uniref:Uncharacterized protein n=1 Tax=Rhizophora mucronata TaxID=61149 RepID=A0A2P2R4Y8_RHIMU